MLTIIIPSYKREYFLDKSVSSILSQLNTSILKKNIKLIVISNSQKNFLMNKIENKIKKKKILFKIIYNKKNLGLTGSINKSVKIANSKYCMVIDDEIIIKRGSLKKLYYFLKKKSPLLLVGKILPYLENKIPIEVKKNFLINLKKKLKKNKYDKYYTLLDFGFKIKKIKSKFAFMSFQVFNTNQYLKFGGYGPDGMSGDKIFMNGNGELNFNTNFKYAIYFPELIGFHAINNKIYNNYLSERSFIQGICSSFEDIRSKNNLYLLKNLIKSFLKILILDKNNEYYFNKSYFMHLLNFYLNGSKFRKYCLRKSYLDFDFSKKINLFPFQKSTYRIW